MNWPMSLRQLITQNNRPDETGKKIGTIYIPIKQKIKNMNTLEKSFCKLEAMKSSEESGVKGGIVTVSSLKEITQLKEIMRGVVNDTNNACNFGCNLSDNKAMCEPHK